MKKTAMILPNNWLLKYHNKSLFIGLWLLLLLAGCKTTKVSEKERDNTVSIKIIQMNDVYEIAALKGGKIGGLDRVAYIADSIKKQYPNTYLVMAGDFLNPSLVGSLKVNGERVRGRQMIEMMNVMGVDLATFGNHEFDLKEHELQQRLNESNFQWTSANVFQKTNDELRVFNTIKNNDTTPIPETVFYDIEVGEEYPVRLGFFSVTINSNPQDYVYYSDYLTEARSAFTALQQAGADIIVALTHLDLDEDKVVANNMTEIDLILGGHEHDHMLVPTNGASIAKADANAKTIYVHTLTYFYKTKNLKIDSQLLSIDDTVPSLPIAKAVVDKWDRILLQEIQQVIAHPDEVIYNTNTPLIGTDKAGRSEQTNLGQIISKAMALSFDTPAEAAIVNGGSFRLDDNLEGEIVSLDVFRVLPFGGDVQKIDISGALLQQVLEYGESQKGTGAYLHRYNIHKNNTTWYVNNAPIQDEKIYHIALSDYLLKGFDIPLLVPEAAGIKKIYKPHPGEPAMDIRKAVITYLKTL